MNILRSLLLPFSLIFGAIALLRRRKFKNAPHSPIPTICIGNLRVGGTGKTPFVEYLAKFLSQNHQIAILSRGYGRKTKGYLNVKEIEILSSEVIGDEPMMYATHFPNVEVVVCEKRKIGIEKLLQKNPNLEAIILDDAFQHLSVNYSLRILLTEYERPFFKDFPLPAGNLREFRSAAKYADIIVVTKCPEELSTEEKERFLLALKPRKGQQVYFVGIRYDDEMMRRLDDEMLKDNSQIPNLTSHSSPLLITGIANPAPLVRYLEAQYGTVHKLHFPDHHEFTKKDIDKIIRLKEQLGGENCTLLTTEKDAVRLQAFKNMPEYHTVSIEIVFLENETVFKEKLLSLLS
ncbi:MAG: tetraacyldisaccharide 4'-kinase [Lentimicrobiaceae bacterium]|nr:tetraacyldisaccharide 4'-kinase [Lentimicrobiaceae bacterium]